MPINPFFAGSTAVGLGNDSVQVDRINSHAEFL
jgi:hypothetical protein